jgi:hypothetical protein
LNGLFWDRCFHFGNLTLQQPYWIGFLVAPAALLGALHVASMLMSFVVVMAPFAMTFK